MGIIELLILAFALAMDAFAVSICLGLKMQKVTIRKALIVGLYFGIFQALMLLIGYLAASSFAEMIESFDHWIVFILLLLLGLKMIVDSFREEGEEKEDASLHPRNMLPYAIATSIDSLAVGISLAFLKADIISAMVAVGMIALILSMIGVKFGGLFGSRFESKAEFAGGLVLILIGVKILLEHLEFIGF